MGVAATLAPKGMGPQDPTKKLAHVGVLLGHLLSQNRVSELSDPGPPLNYQKIYRFLTEPIVGAVSGTVNSRIDCGSELGKCFTLCINNSALFTIIPWSVSIPYS